MLKLVSLRTTRRQTADPADDKGGGTDKGGWHRRGQRITWRQRQSPKAQTADPADDRSNPVSACGFGRLNFN